MRNENFNDMGQTEPSYKGSLGEIDWLDDHEHSCLDVQCRVTDFGSWTINLAMVHFGFLLVNKAREVGKNINGWRSILDNCLTLCETLKKASVDGPFYRNWLVSLMVFLEPIYIDVPFCVKAWVLGGTLNGHLFNCLILKGTKNRIRAIVFILVNAPFFLLMVHFLRWPLDVPTIEDKAKKYSTFRQIFLEMINKKFNAMGQ